MRMTLASGMAVSYRNRAGGFRVQVSVTVVARGVVFEGDLAALLVAVEEVAEFGEHRARRGSSAFGV